MRISSTVEIRDLASHLSKDGYVILNEVFPTSLIDKLHDAYLEEYGSMSSEQMAAKCAATGPNRFLKVGDGRYEIAVTMKQPFSDPSLYANELTASVLQQALGDGYKLSSFTVVVSYPGSPMQHIHRDHSHLFEPDGICGLLPPHAINVAIPFADVDLKSGPTGVWPGSHRWPNAASCDPSKAVSTRLWRGDCMMIDYRTLHAGMPNLGDCVRAILYIVYARGWFFDVRNFSNRNPLDLPIEEYDKLAPAVQILLSRVRISQLRMGGTEKE